MDKVEERSAGVMIMKVVRKHVLIDLCCEMK